MNDVVDTEGGKLAHATLENADCAGAAVVFQIPRSWGDPGDRGQDAGAGDHRDARDG